MDRNTIISLDGVSMVRDERVVLHDINLKVNRGDFIAITGPNGGGKTTLLRIILKLLMPTSGRVAYYADGKPVDRLGVGYLPQKNMIDSRFPITVREVVASGLLSEKGLSRAEVAQRVDEMLDLMGISVCGASGLGRLSGGQLQRALLGRALISWPEVLVLDEPLSYVDKRFEHHIYDLMKDIAGRTTVLLVSHEVSEIAAMASRHIVVDRTLHFCHSGSHFVHYDCDCDCDD